MDRIEPYLERLYRYAYSLCRNQDTARELVQQCALKALGARSAPTDEAAYRSWLFVILRNSLIDERRRDARLGGIGDALPESEIAMEFPPSDERLINVLSVKQAMGKLSEPHRDVIGLVDLAGLSYAEAARILGVPPGTVMSRISRARARLLQLLGESNVKPLGAWKRARN